MPILVPETSGRLDQHDRNVQALAEARNWKQVIAQLDKRLKKSKNDRLLLNKALVQVRMPDLDTQRNGCKLLQTTLASMSPVLDNDVLDAVEDAADSQFHVSDIQHLTSLMWETTLKAQPNNEELLQTVFEKKIAACDWDAARKLCMTKMKTDRDWFLRWVVCVHLISVSRRSTATDMVRTMNSGLAVKSLAKAVSDAISSAQPGSTQKQGAQASLMRTTRDIDLLVEIYNRHGKNGDLVKLLTDIEGSSMASQLGGGLAFTKEKIEALRLSKGWPDLLKLTSSVLHKAINKSSDEASQAAVLVDDWLIWKGYLAALKELGHSSPNFLEDASKLITVYMQDHKNQNARLANMLLLLQNPGAAKNASIDVSEICAANFRDFGNKPFAFSRLKECHLLNATQKKMFLEKCRSAALKRADNQMKSQRSAKDWLTTEINSLKQDYYLVVSTDSSSSVRPKLLRSFAANCIRLYKVSLVLEANKAQLTGDDKEIQGPHERFMGDDAAILAAMALIHLWFLSDDSALIRSAYILETLLSRSRHNYDAIFLAIRVYMYMGQFARAADLFDSLDTKHIQILSASWILVPRISSLHPQQSKRWREGPVGMLQESNRWIKNSRTSLARASVETLRCGSYGNFIRSVETFELNQQTIPAIIIASELDRTSWRARGVTGNVLAGIDIDALNEDVDPRELSAFPNYEGQSCPSLEAALRPGPLPQLSWTKSKLRSRYLRYLVLGGTLQTEDLSGIPGLFREVREASLQYKQGLLSDMTSSESVEDYFVIKHYLICLAALSTATKKAFPSESLSTSISSLTSACETTLASMTSAAEDISKNTALSATSWHVRLRWELFHYLSERSCLCDMLLGCLRFLVLVISRWEIKAGDSLRILETTTLNLETGAQNLRLSTQKWASSLQLELRQPKPIEHLVSTITGNKASDEVVEAFGDADPETPQLLDAREFAVDMANGWIDALGAFTSAKNT